MLKHYVEYLYPGIIVSETSVSEIAERDVSKVEISDTVSASVSLIEL